MPAIVTITTDFGGDVYPAIMKGVIATIDPEVRILDITHTIRPGDVPAGAFALAYASCSFPRGTTHLAVVDPGVGSHRRALVIVGARYIFVGPDNGLLMPAARAQGAYKVYEMTSLDFFSDHVSRVFHGRDVFAPAAALLATGREVPGLRAIADPVDCDFGVPRLTGDAIQGKVIYVDHFGNAVTNVGGEAMQGLLHLGEALEVNGIPATFAGSYHEGKEGDLLLLIGSHGMAELAVTGGSAAARASLASGSDVEIMQLTRHRHGR